MHSFKDFLGAFDKSFDNSILAGLWQLNRSSTHNMENMRAYLRTQATPHAVAFYFVLIMIRNVVLRML